MATTQIFQSTLPVWGATKQGADADTVIRISIHAPRVGSDDFGFRVADNVEYFNPRSPCGERPQVAHQLNAVARFQSTLPVWGATLSHAKTDTTQNISIHAPRVGSDAGYVAKTALNKIFQSTLPVWGATPRPIPQGD